MKVGFANEVWKDVKGYKGIYSVSSFGRIKSGYRFNILKQSLTSNGYRFVNLWKDKKPTNKMAHIIIAEAFLGHVPNGQVIVVDHIDNNKTNNMVSNLQLITQRENSLKDKPLPKSGYKGVVWSTSNNKWQVRPRLNGKKFFVGYFDCPKYASDVYIDFTNYVDNNEWTKPDLIIMKENYKEKIRKLKK